DQKRDAAEAEIADAPESLQIRQEHSLARDQSIQNPHRLLLRLNAARSGMHQRLSDALQPLTNGRIIHRDVGNKERAVRPGAVLNVGGHKRHAKEPPSCRIILVRPVPWAISAPRRSAKATVVRGTKRQESATPRRIIGQNNW